MEYQVALLKGGGSATCESTAVHADNDNDALQKAKDWTASLDFIPEDASLQIVLNGRGRNLGPGEF